MRDKRSFRDGKGVSLRVQTEGAPGKPAYRGDGTIIFFCGKKALTCGILIESKNIRICFGQTVNRRAVISPKGE